MNVKVLFKAFFWILFAGGTIRVWELYRDDALSVIGMLSSGGRAATTVTDVLSAGSHAATTSTETNKQGVAEKVDKADEVAAVTEPKRVAREEIGLLSFEDGFAKIASKAMNSVVNIATLHLVEEEGGGLADMFKGTPFDEAMRDFFDAPHRRRTKRTHALGSGFIVQICKDKFYVVTNNHVVEKATKVILYLHDKTEIPAEVYATDQRTDIAVLVVDIKDSNVAVNNLRVAEWGDSDEIKEGNWVIAIGNPFGLGGTVTSGIISAKGRTTNSRSQSMADDLIQHSAAINTGNSGGCLLDIHGKVVGVNNAILSSSGGGNIGIGFAIPSNIAKTIVEQLIEHKKTLRGWVGVTLQKVDAGQAESLGLIEKRTDKSEVFGAYVSKIIKGSPAAEAGIKVGDIIIEVDGTKISAKNSIQSIIGRAKIGSTIKVRAWRQKDAEKWEPVDFDVVVGDFDKASKEGLLDDKNDQLPGTKDLEKEIGPLGITVSRLPDQYKDEYPNDVSIIITRVDEDECTPFYGPVFSVGDGIISANNRKVTSVEQFQKIIDEIIGKKENKGRPIPFIISRHGMQVMVAVPLDFEKACGQDQAGKAGPHGKDEKDSKAVDKMPKPESPESQQRQKDKQDRQRS
jgi:serine protease Do